MMKRGDEKAIASQRIRAGLTGLACVFLIVLLAAAFLNIARDREADRQTAEAIATNRASPEPARDPLAELGVAPDAAVPATPAPPAATAPPPAPTP